MNQKLLQIKKLLTFEEICPLWADRINRGHLVGEKGGTNMHHGCKCVVGEAYKFPINDYYAWNDCKDYCVCCKDYSRLFCDLVYHDQEPEHEATHSMDYYIRGFTDHWNECHV